MKIVKSKFICIGLICLLCLGIGIKILFFHKNSDKEKNSISSMKNSALLNLGYNDNDIEFLEKYISKEHIDYVLNQVYSPTLVMNIVKEKYYIDDYLEKYINYYFAHENTSYDEIIKIINTHVDNEFYEELSEADINAGKFILLNKYYGTDSSYKGENLVDVDNKYSLYGSTYETQLSQECYEAFVKMYTDAKKDGFDFRINSSFRSYEKQEKIYNSYVAKDGVKLADTYSARPGFSEHQTGFAFDLRDYPLSTDDFSKTDEFVWMQDNAFKYGFILRFPKNKEYITGYQYESWHYRYCGIECSTYIHDNNITFEEYYEYFIKFNNPRNLS